MLIMRIIISFECDQTANHEGNYDEYDYGECENENQDVKRILGKN